MNEIKRQKINDILVPNRELIKRPVMSPANNSSPRLISESDRIGRNPFFERNRRVQETSVPEKRKRKFRGTIIAMFFSLLLLAGFFVANYFVQATIDIIPERRSKTLDNNFVASKSEANGGLTFQFMSLEETKSKEVVATVEQKIQRKASGKVIIYNAYSVTPQRLIKNTRLETPDRRIFRINDSVVVPGLTTVKGETVPGSVQATVFADAPGKEYNIGTTNFTIPGFKGDPRYSKFYAVSKTDSPLSGGYSGTLKVPSDEALTLAYTEMKNTLKKDAIEKARAQIPANVTFFPGSMIIKFEEVPREIDSAESGSKVSVKATVSVFFFDTAMLSDRVIKVAFPDEKEQEFSIADTSQINFAFAEPVENVVLEDLEKIHFSLRGDVNFVGQIDPSKIVSAIAGKKKSAFSSIVDDIPNVATGTKATIRPMWKTAFPDDHSRIIVNIKNDNLKVLPAR